MGMIYSGCLRREVGACSGVERHLGWATRDLAPSCMVQWRKAGANDNLPVIFRDMYSATV